jgi:hypothetical protein
MRAAPTLICISELGKASNEVVGFVHNTDSHFLWNFNQARLEKKCRKSAPYGST